MTRADHVASTRLGRLYRGQTAVDFYGHRRASLIVAAAVVVVTVLSLWAQGLNLGLDFEGGDAWDVPASESFGVDEANEVLADNGVSTTGARIQRRTSETSDVITIQVEELDRETTTAVTEDFAEAAGVAVDDISFSFTSSTWGAEITEKAIRALVIFLVVVSLFISVRFEWRMAMAALAAMAHDVVATVGIYSLFQFEVTPATVIAFLTILGYSLYDTIVVFDRIKENESKFAGTKTPYSDIINISMNQVLMRSINTSISSILPALSLLVIGSWILGAVTLREFALALLIGMLSGVYSSIFIASPTLGMLKSRGDRNNRRTPLTGEDLRAKVMGAGVTGRTVERSVATAGSDRSSRRTSPDSSNGHDGDDGSAADDHDDLVRTAAVVQPADKILGHEPRARRKRRR
jgi:preprotein translocase subunit SecF